MNEAQAVNTQKYARSVREAVSILSGALKQKGVLRFPPVAVSV